MHRLRDIIQIAENLASFDLAYDWDNVGLQIGDYDQEIKDIMLTLDTNEKVIDEAISKGCQLIISHHPFIFKPLEKINFQDKKGKIIYKIIKNNINLLVMHTNLDLANGGLNDYLFEILGLKDKDFLEYHTESTLYKLVCFIPYESFEKVKMAILNSGAGQIAKYSHSSFSTKGKGTFKPLSGSNPYIGKENTMQELDEIRFETIVSKKYLDKIIEKLKEVHAYEKVAYDVFSLSNQDLKYGLGRIGKTYKEIKLIEFIDLIKKRLNILEMKYVGKDSKLIKNVALCTGSGAKLISLASEKGAELYITSDIKYHEAQLAEDLGIALLDIGHYHSEVIVKKLFYDYFLENIQNINLYISETQTNPWNYST